VKNALLPSCPTDPELPLCAYDGFATKLSPSSGLIYSTYITALGEPEAMTFVNDVVVDAAGNAYVAGFSNATSLPIKDAVQATRSTGICLGGFDRFCFDAYVLGLAPDGSLHFGSYLGGTLDEYNQDIAIDSTGAIYLIGYSDGSGFPTTGGSIQPTKRADYDFFVAKIALESGTPPTPVPNPDLPYKTYLPILTRR
jgi:large repetitive protein